MTHVFVSYSTDDRTRVAKLVAALERHKLTTWWDQNTQAGVEWRLHILDQLRAARCVVVLWTPSSVASQWVREEAEIAKRRGVLFPVRFGEVQPPFGFGEVQCADFTSWSGSASDPAVIDLVEAIRARMEGRPAGPAEAPHKRLLRRAAIATATTSGALALMAFGLDAFGVQSRACAISPAASDTCGALGWGGRPTQEERLAWESRRDGCDALRAHLARFPDGALRVESQARLDAVKRVDTWVAGSRELPGYVRQQEMPMATEAAATEDAIRQVEKEVRGLCTAASEQERLTDARATAVRTDCRTDPRGGTTCSASFTALCSLEQLRRVEVCE